MQRLLIDPIPFPVQLLNDGVAAETEETLTLTLIEINPPVGQENFLLGTVDIRIRDINSMYSYNTWLGGEMCGYGISKQLVVGNHTLYHEMENAALEICNYNFSCHSWKL